VLSDLNIVVEDVEDQIGAFRAEELARAALAEANYKVYLEKIKERDKPRDDDLSEDLSMGIVDNSVRLETENNSVHNLTKGVREHIVKDSDNNLTKGVEKHEVEFVVAKLLKGS
jgi:hypothetical protein